MLIFSNPFYIDDDGNGYALDERDAICASCHKIIDRQKKYRGVDTEFKFDTNKIEWKYCPYCGEKLEY